MRRISGTRHGGQFSQNTVSVGDFIKLHDTIIPHGSQIIFQAI